MNRLYHYPLSPFSRKVRLALAEKRIEVELVEERYWEQDPDFLRRNPAGQVPVLRLGNRTLSDSQAICEWLEETVPTPPLLPQGADARYEVRRLCAWFDGKFHVEVTKRLMGERVFKKLRGGGVPDSQAVKAGSKEIKFHLAYMTHLLETRRWLAGNEMTLADFAAAAQLSVLDYVSDVPWHAYETVKDWYAKIKSRPAFRSLLADQIPGYRPAAHYADLDF
jgi:glutathione S-transferase